jgi:hypothetical protein
MTTRKTTRRKIRERRQTMEKVPKETEKIQQVEI